MYLIGTGASETLNGGLDDDILDGVAGDDLVRGAEGADTLYGGDGQDRLEGGSGDDELYGEDGGDSLEGGEGADALRGGLGFDFAAYRLAAAGTSVDLAAGGLAGDALGDTYRGIEGVIGSLYDDLVWGDARGNTFIDEGGDDRFDGRDGADRYTPTGRTRADSTVAGVQLAFGSDATTLLDGFGLDAISLGIAGDIAAGAGVAIRDLGSGQREIDVVLGVEAFDASTGTDWLRGSAGDEYFRPFGTGTDTIDGGAGFDHVSFTLLTGPVIADLAAGTATAGGNVVALVTAVEALRGTLASDQLSGDAGANWIAGGTGQDAIAGRDGDDHLLGEDGNDVLVGGGGNDLLQGGTGADLLDGGAGLDMASYDDAQAAVDVDLLTAKGKGGEAAGDRYVNVEQVSGSGYDDTLRGDDADNLLLGRAGSDTLTGCDGDDLVHGDGGPALAALSPGLFPEAADPEDDCGCEDPEDEDPVGGGDPPTFDDVIDGGHGNDTLHGERGSDLLDGDCDDDSLSGGAGIDVLYGGEGNDTLEGGASIDLLFGGDGFDTLTYRNSPAAVVVNLANPAETSGGEASADLAALLVEMLVEGGDPQQVFLSAIFTDVLQELTRMTSVGGLLTIGDFFGFTPDIEGIEGSAGADRLGGNLLDNLLQGGAGNDTLAGADGDDTLDGGAGSDSMSGGAGDDSYVVANTTDVVVEAAGGGVDTVATTLATYTLGTEVENGRILAAGTASMTGNAADNVIVAGAGSNVIDGAAGRDTASFEAASAAVIVSLAVAGAQATGGSGSDTLVSIENLVGSAFADRLTGNAAANRLAGGAGNDVLVGGAGNDTMQGGDGDDTFVVDAALDVVVEDAAASGGRDLVRAAIDYRLGEGLEDLRLEGTALRGTGNALDNRITGNDGANTLVGGGGNDELDGGAGNDSMAGGTGDDTYVVAQALDRVTEQAGAGFDTVRAGVTHTLAANVEALVITVGGAINGTGNAGANLIVAGAGSNVLDGLGGVDTVSYEAASRGVKVSLATTAAQATGGSGTDTLRNFENLTGSAFADELRGSAAANRIDGGAGADAMLGGAGNDTYVVDNTGDRVTEAAGAGTDTVVSSVNFTLGNHLERLTLVGTTSLTGTGNALANVITANDGNSVLDGGAGNDTVSYAGAAAAVAVSLAITSAQATGGSGADVLTRFENLTGSAHDDRLRGDDGANRLDGGAGVDTLAGGLGDDVYVVDSSRDVVVETTGAGTDVVESSASHVLAAEVEVLRLVGAGAINGTGNAGDNTVHAGAGSNLLDGGEGRDLLSYESAGGAVTVSLSVATRQATGGSGNDLVLNFEDLTGSRFADRLTGSGDGNLLDGLAGADTMAGGNGDDTYRVDQAGDVVRELAGGGTDTVFTRVAYTLPAAVENLVLEGSAAATLTGNGDDNRLTGNAAANTLLGLGGNDTLDGGAGGDRMEGGSGNDRYIVEDAGDVVVETGTSTTEIDTVSSALDHVLGPNVENLELTGSAANGAGNERANRITGNDAANTLSGAAGNDTLDGGAGVDSLVGGAGSDTYVVDDAGDVVDETSTSTTDVDTVSSSVDWTLGTTLENLVLTGIADVDGTGNASANRLTGNAGANRLDGRGGADTMTGGDGGDTYVVDSSADQIVESGATGRDAVNTTIDFTLPSGVEDLYMTGLQRVGRGNALDNVIYANAYDNELDGEGGFDVLSFRFGATGPLSYNLFSDFQDNGSGADFFYDFEGLEGGDFADSLYGNDVANLLAGLGGDDYLTGAGGNDTVQGGDGFDELEGGDGDDVLDGGGDDDRLTGGAGADSMTGGQGLDTFVLGDADGDRIADFVSADDTVVVTGPIGDGDVLVEGIRFASGPSTFLPTDELVLITTPAVGTLTPEAAAAVIGNAVGTYAPGRTAVFVVGNGSDTGIFRFGDQDADSFVEAYELQLFGVLEGTTGLGSLDVLFG